MTLIIVFGILQLPVRVQSVKNLELVYIFCHSAMGVEHYVTMQFVSSNFDQINSIGIKL